MRVRTVSVCEPEHLGPQVRHGAANLALGLVLDIALVGAIKGMARRARPVYNHAGDFVVVVAVDQYSFPSGHASRHDRHLAI